MKIIRDFISPNYDDRPHHAQIAYIILHYTEMLFEEAIAKLCDKASKVSCHYLIKENGEILELVNPAARAWHAGQSHWNGVDALNESSIGIELDNLGDRPFIAVQMESCQKLCNELVKLYRIPKENILGHSDIAPNRKIDPGVYFDWEWLAMHGLGIWSAPSDVIPAQVRIQTKNECVSVQTRLKTFGYKIDITGQWDRQTSDVIRAFQAHFCRTSLLQKGLKFYSNLSSEYVWDRTSDAQLNELLKCKIEYK